MLMRMYTRWAERRGFAVEMLDLSEGEEAGHQGRGPRDPRAVCVWVPAPGSRASTGWSGSRPFDANARRHTSFASVFVYPVVNEEINIEIRDDDLKIDVYRASGAGGQHVNKTSSAVRITHIPTGIVVASQQERSQFKNKATAMKMLKNRLYQLEADRQAAAEGRTRRDEGGRHVRQSDSQLRVPAVHDGQRPPDRAQDPGRAEGHGRRRSIRSSRRISRRSVRRAAATDGGSGADRVSANVTTAA